MRSSAVVPDSIVAVWRGRILTFLVVVIAWVFFRAQDLHSAMRMLSAMVGMGDGPISGFSAFPQIHHAVLTLLGMLFFVWALPNTQTLVGYPSITPDTSVASTMNLRWKPNWTWGIPVSAILVIGILSISGGSEFIYFHF